MTFITLFDLARVCDSSFFVVAPTQGETVLKEEEPNMEKVQEEKSYRKTVLLLTNFCPRSLPFGRMKCQIDYFKSL